MALTTSQAQPDQIQLGKSWWFNPRTRLPRTDFGDFNNLLGKFQGMQLSPQQIASPQIATANASSMANRQRLAESMRRMGLGNAPAMQRSMNLEQQAQDAGMRGNIYGQSVVDSSTFSSGIMRSALDALLGRAQIQSGERGQDIGQNADLINYLSSVYPRG